MNTAPNTGSRATLTDDEQDNLDCWSSDSVMALVEQLRAGSIQGAAAEIDAFEAELRPAEHEAAAPAVATMRRIVEIAVEIDARDPANDDGRAPSLMDLLRELVDSLETAVADQLEQDPACFWAERYEAHRTILRRARPNTEGLR